MLAQVLTVSLLELHASVKVFDLEAVICIQHSSHLFLRGFAFFSDLLFLDKTHLGCQIPYWFPYRKVVVFFPH